MLLATATSDNNLQPGYPLPTGATCPPPRNSRAAQAAADLHSVLHTHHTTPKVKGKVKVKSGPRPPHPEPLMKISGHLDALPDGRRPPETNADLAYLTEYGLLTHPAHSASPASG